MPPELERAVFRCAFSSLWGHLALPLQPSCRLHSDPSSLSSEPSLTLAALDSLGANSGEVTDLSRAGASVAQIWLHGRASFLLLLLEHSFGEGQPRQPLDAYLALSVPVSFCFSLTSSLSLLSV